MRVFVTGSGGFVGRRLLPLLHAAGHEADGADRELDVTDADGLARVFERERPDAIIHLAAQSSVAASFADPALCYRVNFVGTRCLLQAVRRSVPRARVLLIGSADQYGGSEPGAPASRESDPLRPRSPYARSKAAAELLGSLAAREGLDVVRVRAFNHTGPGQADSFVASSFARQAAEIEAGQREPQLRVGNLESVRDFLDVDDVLDAYVRMLDPAFPADVYNVARGDGVAIRVVLDTLLSLAGVAPRIEADPERVRPTDQLIGDASRLRDACGWQPRVPLETTLGRLLDDWRGRIDGGGAHSAPRSSA